MIEGAFFNSSIVIAKHMIIPRLLGILLIAVVLIPTSGLGQEAEVNEVDSDSLYREDQFYVGVTYDVLSNAPAQIAQTGFSSGFHLGFIRDIPLNERRNVALGLGLGLSSHSINHNLQISQDDSGNYSYSIASDGSFTKNKFAMQIIEIPIEFRWRSSTPEIYKFWRVYAGFKLGYLLSNSYRYRGDPKDYKLKQIEDFNDFEYGLTLSVGYDKFNIHINYVLNNIFTDRVSLNGEPVDMRMIKIGLMLYIL